MFAATIDLARVFREAGLLNIPLGLCSVIAVFIIIERLIALRSAAVLPEHLVEAVVEGAVPPGDRRSTFGRILDFTHRHRGDVEAIKSYARLEVIKMEKGIAYLDTIYAAAPLIGLIGTVTGLLGAFSVVDPNTRMPDPVIFTESVGYALSATVLGLCIALPALISSGHFQRTVEKHTAQIDVLLERVLARDLPPGTTTASAASTADSASALRS